jgi:broad specificity phosphatase PhoE
VAVSALYLVRHGQAAFGETDYDRLTSVGTQQCAQLARHWAALERAAPLVFTGTLRRQRDSAEAFTTTLGEILGHTPTITVIEGLEEYDHVTLLQSYAARTHGHADLAALNGNRRAFHKFIEQALQCWARGELPDFEPFSKFRDRCVGALDRLMLQVGRGRTAVVFGSAGSLAAAIQPIIGLGDRDLLRLKLNFHNTGITKVLFNDDAAVIESINAIPHLEQPGLSHLVSQR